MKKNTPDYILLLFAGMIIFFGLFVLAGAVSVGSEIRFVRQIIVGLLPGILMGFIVFKLPIPFIKKWAPYIFLFNIFLVLLLLIPGIGETRGGATRWLSLGLISFQPAEFLKFTFIIYFSGWLANKTKKKQKKANIKEDAKEMLLPFLIVVGVIGVLLMLQPDFSTLVIIASTGMIIYFLAKTPFWHSLFIFLGAACSFFVLIRVEPYRLQRLVGAFNPELDPLNVTYHLRQMLITVGSGGLTGVGLGMSQQKFGLVPEPATDSIFAILAEETGFIGATILVLLFFGFFVRSFLIAKNNKDSFLRLAVFGVASWIFIQTSINIGVVVGLLPITGIPLPLVSYGSSHLISELIAIGFIFNASQYVRK